MAGNWNNQPEGPSSYLTRKDLDEILAQHSQSMIAEMAEQMKALLGQSANAPRYPAPPAQHSRYQTTLPPQTCRATPAPPHEQSHAYPPRPRYHSPAPPLQPDYYHAPPAQPVYQPAPVLSYTSQQYSHPVGRKYPPSTPNAHYRRAPPPARYAKPAPPTPRQFQKLPMSYTEIFQQLMAKNKITPIPAHPSPKTTKKDYNPNATCVYHSGQRGHDIEYCFCFKVKIEELINSKMIEFTEDQPDIAANPSPDHSKDGAIFSGSGKNGAITHDRPIQELSINGIRKGSTPAPSPCSPASLDNWTKEVVCPEHHPFK